MDVKVNGFDLKGKTMIQTFAISQAVESLSLVEEKFNFVQSSDNIFFVEWYQNLPELNEAEKTTLDIINSDF